MQDADQSRARASCYALQLQAAFEALQARQRALELAVVYTVTMRRSGLRKQPLPFAHSQKPARQ